MGMDPYCAIGIRNVHLKCILPMFPVSVRSTYLCGADHEAVVSVPA